MLQVEGIGATMESQSISVITRACDMCRRKKIRCETTSGDCLQCVKYKTQCHFTPIAVKRKPRRPAGDKRVEQLEKRLKWMEDQLKRSMEAQQSKTTQNVRIEPRGPETPIPEQSQPESYYSAQQTQTEGLLDPDLAKSETSINPEGLSLPHTNGSLAPIVDNEASSSPWNIKHIGDGLARLSFKALPPKEEALSLIKKSLQGFNAALPLFDEPTFISSFESMDWNMNDPGWWACLNVVLALTHRFGFTTTLDSPDDREAWGYFQNAVAVINQLTTMDSTISSVQALLGMSIALTGTPNPTPVSILIASAIKQAHSLGLHRQFRESGLTTAEIGLRRRVFWVAYCIDKDISIQNGHPPSQDDDDMDVDLPFENLDPPTRPARPNEPGYFNYRVRLALIQGQIYKRLCSVKAAKQTVTERLLAAKELESMLQNWRASIPTYLLRDYLNQSPTESTLERVSLPLGLQLPYFNSLATMYNSLPIPPIMSSPTSYALEASKTIQLLQFTPRGHNACVRAVLHIFVSATMTLLTHTMTNPSNPQAMADLKLIEPLLKTLHMLFKKDKSEEISQMYQSCAAMFARARQAVDRANLERTRWEEKRLEGSSTNGKESVEEFLRRIEYISSGYDVDHASISREL